MKVRNLHVNNGVVITAKPLSRNDFLKDRQGRTFADVLDEPQLPFDEVLEFFNDPERQRRMDETELHHDRPPLAGVVRELEAHPAIDRHLAHPVAARSKRLRQAVGVVVRLIMERRGWRKSGKKGSLGVRGPAARRSANPNVNDNGAGNNTGHHNTGGLAFWFLRAERYERKEGMPFRSVRERCRHDDSQAEDSQTEDSQADSHAPVQSAEVS